MTWVKGQSGNAAGKPVGTISRTVKLRNMIADRIPDVINTMIEAAVSGDVQAARVLIERVLPAVKSESLPVNLDLPEKANLTTIGESIIQSVTQGSISVEAGAQLMSAITGQAKLIEITELEARIAKLEGVSEKTQE